MQNNNADVAPLVNSNKCITDKISNNKTWKIIMYSITGYFPYHRSTTKQKTTTTAKYIDLNGLCSIVVCAFVILKI